MGTLGHSQEHSYSSSALSSADITPNTTEMLHKSQVLSGVLEMLKGSITCKDECFCAGSTSYTVLQELSHISVQTWAHAPHVNVGIGHQDNRTLTRPQTISEAGQNSSDNSFPMHFCLLLSPLQSPVTQHTEISFC